MAVTKIEVLHLNWDRTDQNERWAISQPTGAFPEELPKVKRAAQAALGTGKYDLVATKTGSILDESEALEFAFLQTNHIDRPWNDGQGAFVAEPGSQRSTSVGDIVKVTRGDAGGWTKATWHVAVSFGFEQIICTTRQQPTPSALADQGSDALRLATCYPHLYS